MADEETTTGFNADYWVWGHRDSEPRFLHTMLRVKDVDTSLRFYLDGLGMKELDRFDIESRRVTAIFIGFGDYSNAALLELTDYWDDDGQYTHGSAFGHISIGVPDIKATIARLEAMGTEISERPRVLMNGGPRVAFVKDPDGFSIELIQIRRDQEAGRSV